MKVIIFEDTVYKVSEKEYKKLTVKNNEIKNAQYPLNSKLEEELRCYLDDNKNTYTLIGCVMFDHRR